MPCLREEREALERSLIGPYGTLSAQSRGRLRPEAPDPVRSCFQRDVDRITHSKAFRRLKHKTQVFLQPEGDHYRTRLTHTLEVTRLARTIARALRLNEDLCEAIGLGHDLGHTPFGHAGERALRELMPGGFHHYAQSLRVVDRLEKGGRGLNLCYETRMGILNHTTGAPDDSREATVVRLSDRIAYINHDLDDAIRAGILTEDALPEEIHRHCGGSTSQRINSFVTDLIYASASGTIGLSAEMQPIFDLFHDFMYEAVYRNPTAKGEESKVYGILAGIFRHYRQNPERLPEEFKAIAEADGLERAVCDYVAGMTDSYAISVYGDLFIPAAWSVK